MQSVLKKLLQNLDLNIPDSVIDRLLDTPVGTSLRGISDALDSLYIENNVFQLPKEYLEELDFPYLMVLPNRKEAFVVVANDNERDTAIPEWEGVVLTAKKTNKTPNYKYVWLRNVVGRVTNNQICLATSVLLLLFVILTKPDIMTVLHTIMSGLGVWISTLLLKKENMHEENDRICKIGQFVDCEQVLNSKGSQLLVFLRMSDLAFLFFATELSLIFIGSEDCQGYSLLLLLAGCCFTLYSVIYQIVSIRKICLYCMFINLIVWFDTIIFVLNYSRINYHKPFFLFLAATISYIIWKMTSKYLSLSERNSSLRHKESVLYSRELFEFLLSKERNITDVDDKFANVDGASGSDVVTMFVHPKCKNCKNIYQYIPELRERVIVKTVSLAQNNADLHLFCKMNQITRTPTIVFNGKEIPDTYDIKDLKYIL
jgi:uncharacterized membrane protein/glutaredoxin